MKKNRIEVHSFSVKDAELFGVNKAIILQHLKWHMENNQFDPTYLIEDKVWCYAKLKSLEEIYTYFNNSSLSRWLTELENDGVIISMKPHRNRGNHEKFYHVIGHLDFISQNGKSFSQNGNSMNSQNGNSSIYNYKNNYKRDKLTSFLSTNGIEIPKQLNDDAILCSYSDYISYMKIKFGDKPNIFTIQTDFDKLVKLMNTGNHPVDVINQTIHTRNKSFFELRKGYSNSQNDPFTYDGMLRHVQKHGGSTDDFVMIDEKDANGKPKWILKP